MNIDELVRRGRPESAGWARSEVGRRVLDGVVTADPAGKPSGRRVVGRSRTSRPVLRWSFLGTGLVGAAAASVLAVSVISAPPGTQVGDPPPVGGQPGAADSIIAGATPVTARDILLAAATRAEQAPAESGKYWHVKTLDVFGPQRVSTDSDGYRLLRRVVNESWDASDPQEASWTGRRDFGVRPYSAADEQAWRAAGSPTEWTLDTDGPNKLILSTRPGEGTLTKDTDAPRYLEDLGQLSLEQVRLLPDEQGALRAWVTSRIQAEMGAAAGSAASDQLLFGFLSRMLLDTPAPPQVRAAAFRILADVPGVHSLGAVTDESGRSGQGVEFRSDSTTVRLIVDPSAHRLLGTKTSSMPKGPNAPVKESSTLVLMAQWSDAAPQLPTLPQE